VPLLETRRRTGGQGQHLGKSSAAVHHSCHGTVRVIRGSAEISPPISERGAEIRRGGQQYIAPLGDTGDLTDRHLQVRRGAPHSAAGGQDRQVDSGYVAGHMCPRQTGRGELTAPVIPYPFRLTDGHPFREMHAKRFNAHPIQLQDGIPSCPRIYNNHLNAIEITLSSRIGNNTPTPGG
jgi:hypothetical protein